jgi:hypothetical protein
MSSTETTIAEETAPPAAETPAQDPPAPKKALDPELAKRVFQTDSMLVAKIGQLGLAEAQPFADLHAQACEDTDRLADDDFSAQYAQARSIAEVLTKYAESRAAQPAAPVKRARDEVKSPQAAERELAQRYKQNTEERLKAGAQKYLEQVSDILPGTQQGIMVPETLSDFTNYMLSEPGTFKGKLRSFATQEEANRHVYNLVHNVPATRTEIVNTAASGSSAAGITFRDLMRLTISQ